MHHERVPWQARWGWRSDMGAAETLAFLAAGEETRMTEEQRQSWESMVDRAAKKRPGDTMAANPRVVLAMGAEMQRLRAALQRIEARAQVIVADLRERAEPNAFRTVGECVVVDAFASEVEEIVEAAREARG